MSLSRAGQYKCVTCSEWVHGANLTAHEMRDCFRAATHEEYQQRLEQLMQQAKAALRGFK